MFIYATIIHVFFNQQLKTYLTKIFLTDALFNNLEKDYKAEIQRNKRGETLEISEKKFLKYFKKLIVDLPNGPVVKNLPVNAGDTGLSPGLGRFHMPQGN